MAQDFEKIKMLTGKLDEALEGYNADEARSALLTLLTWHISTLEVENHNDFIDYMCAQLKLSVATQIEVDAENNKTVN